MKRHRPVLRTPSKRCVRRLVKQHLRELNTPRSLAIWMILDHADKTGGNDDDFQQLSLDPMWFNSPEDYIEFSYPFDLCRKSEILNYSSSPTQVAAERFLEAERMCESTNRKLQLSRDPTGRLGELVHSVRKNISELLPTIDREFLDAFVEEGGWGSGSTSSCKGSRVDFYSKLVSHQHATLALLPVAKSLSQEILGMGDVTVADHNTVAFVPKDAKTDRCVAVEPSINSYLQRAVGKALRTRLRRWGVDLTSQEKNRTLARIGSIDGSFATIDLSMASDTISSKVIPYLISDESWVSLLRLLRTPYWKGSGPLEGQSGRYHKWSSMGNGYTFELETLIFSACVRSVVRRGDQWAVYGDDIVVPTYAVQELATLLDHLGFVLNSSKTFTTGPFRESCGEDYFLGVAVRSFFLKGIKENTLFVWANWIMLNSKIWLPKTWSAIIAAQPNRTFSPSPSDGAFVLLWEEPKLKPAIYEGFLHGRRGYFWYEWRFRPRKRPLNKVTDVGGISAHCRLIQADEPTERQPVQLTEREVGRWERKKSFTPM